MIVIITFHLSVSLLFPALHPLGQGDHETFEKRPLSKSALICSISVLHSNLNPRNIYYIPVVKILMRLDLERN